MAIVPFNVLTDETAPDVIRIGAAAALRQDLLSSPTIVATLVEDDAGAYAATATESALVTVTRSNGGLHGELTITNLATQHSKAVIEEDGIGYIDLVNRLAKRITPAAGVFSTTSNAALRAYSEALIAKDQPAREAALREAITTDPKFGLGYVSLLESETDPAASGQTLAAAEAESSHFTVIDRARLGVAAARVEHAGLMEQTKSAQALVTVAPNDVDGAATLGWERFLLGDAADGERWLRHAVDLEPNEQALRRQLALGLMAARRFDAAMVEFRTLQNDTASQPELAVCLLLKGDAAGANRLMDEFFTAQKNAQGAAQVLVRANWVAASAGAAKGADFLSQQKFTLPVLGAVAASQAAVWEVYAGRDADAQRALRQAPAVAANPLAMAYNAAAKAALTGKGAPQAMPYTLFVRRQYDAAADAWNAVVKQTGNADLRARAMLAASLDRAGRGDEAKQILVEPFPPNVVGADPYSAICFNEMRRLLKL